MGTRAVNASSERRGLPEADAVRNGRPDDPRRTRFHGHRAPVDLTDPGVTTYTRPEYEQATA